MHLSASAGEARGVSGARVTGSCELAAQCRFQEPNMGPLQE